MVFVSSIIALVTLFVPNTATDFRAERFAFIAEVPATYAQAFEREIESFAAEISLKVIYDAPLLYALSSQADVGWTEKLAQLRSEGYLISWQNDEVLEYRNNPNDPLWPEQWGHLTIGLDEAWNISTGGMTQNGDSIVVAILDSGFELDHPDLAQNWWLNSSEVPNDGLDNDGNGYIDDYRGLNVIAGNDQHFVMDHGTAVAGIIGARGDNGLGVSGVNWDVKILPISGVGTESQLIMGYRYVKEMRERYDRTGGEQGAYIVVSNLSAGIDNAFAEDHPLWCALYDDLGSAGVLSVASTTNNGISVDLDGDMPSTCTSEFLIVVTNTTVDDTQFSPSGYGAMHVDLGAPGSHSMTTSLNRGYSAFGSTSAAAPHVAGVVALLYSIPCPALGAAMQKDPSATALRMKGSLLNTTYRIDDLVGRTLTNGRLDAANAMNHICSDFSPPADKLIIERIFPNPASDNVTLIYRPASTDIHQIEIYDVQGRRVKQVSVEPVSEVERITLNISDLIAGPFVLSVQTGDKRKSQEIIISR